MRVVGVIMDNFKSGDVVCNEKDVTNDSCDADVTPLPLQAEGGDETQSMSESLITGTKDSGMFCIFPFVRTLDSCCLITVR